MSQQRVCRALQESGDYLSGQELSRTLGISRAAVWKAVEALRRQGYDIEARTGRGYRLIGAPDFLSRETEKRFVEDVYGVCPLFPEPIVGFQNKSAVITGIETPLLTGLSMGYGNDGEKRPEGYQKGSVFASALTGPILVKNPALLREVTRRVLAHAGAEVPETIPVDGELERGYAVTAEQLRKRAEG